jgi:acyl-CoA synthetase (AMP-forming)/AMP-acid ligase II
VDDRVGCETLADRIRAGAETHGSVRTVFDRPDGRVESTVAELVADAERVAGALQHAGIGVGDVVAVQLGSNRDGFVGQIAVALCGAVLLPIVQIYGPRELTFILRQSGAVGLIVPDRVRGRDHLATIARTTLPKSLRTLVVAGEAVPDGALSLSELLGPDAKPFRTPRLDPDDRAMLVYTSGTTADPKGVQHSHRSLGAELRSPTMLVRAEYPVRQLAMFPSGHVAGLLGMCRVLVNGVPTVLQESWDPANAARLIDEFELTNGAGAPIQLAGLLDQQAAGTASLASMREFMTGAANVPPSLVERADRAGIPAYRSYGSSEHPTITAGDYRDSLHVRAYTDGRVLGDNEIRVVDELGEDLPEGTPGEIVSRGSELFLGYTDPALNLESFLPGGWFRTGDVGVVSDGLLTLTDRRKDIIIRGGENLSSKEIEDVLAAHPAVAEAAVVGAPDERLGERVAAYVVLLDGASLGLDEVRDHFATVGVARQKTPERLEVLSEFPRTPSGKIQKYVLRQRLR